MSKKTPPPNNASKKEKDMSNVTKLQPKTNADRALDLIKNAKTQEDALAALGLTGTSGRKFNVDVPYRVVEPQPAPLPRDKKGNITTAVGRTYIAVVTAKKGISLKEATNLLGSPTTTGHAFRLLARLGLIEPVPASKS